MATSDQDIAALRDDLASLKRDMLGLIEHLKAGATKSAQTASDQVNDDAKRIFDSVAASGDWSAKAIADKVEAQPIAALLIALGIGYVAGRVLSR